MKYLIIIFIAFWILTGCIAEPLDIHNEVECLPSSFVGKWEYQSTDGVVLDSIPDIMIELSDEERSDLQIDGLHYNVKSLSSCTAGDLSGFLDVTYELKSGDELLKRTTIFLVLGFTSIYKRK